MQEKNMRHTPEPEIPEALYPEIGNGASLVVKDHDFLLLSPDPTKALEKLLLPDQIGNEDSIQEPIVELPKEEDILKKQEATTDSDRPQQLQDASIKASKSEPKTIPTAKVKSTKKEKVEEIKAPTIAEKAETKSKVPTKPRTTKVGAKKVGVKVIRKKKSETPAEASGDVAATPPKKSTRRVPAITVSGSTKAPKPGKRIRKAAKAVQKQDTVKKAPAKKTIAKKAVTKKAPVEKAPVKKAPAKKAALQQAPIMKAPMREKFVLSPFTEWLKGLGGADYVHPYDDDFALTQEKGVLKEVISETYADLLATQGYKDRAIVMYLKLIEKYPEKSSFFAAKIEALQ